MTTMKLFMYIMMSVFTLTGLVFGVCVLPYVLYDPINFEGNPNWVDKCATGVVIAFIVELVTLIIGVFWLKYFSL